MSLHIGRQGRLALIRIGGVGCFALLGAALLPAAATAGPQYACTGVDFVDPTSGVALIDPEHGSIGCVLTPGGTVTLDGRMNESADVGTSVDTSGLRTQYHYDGGSSRVTTIDHHNQGTTTQYTYDDRTRLLSDTDAQGVTSYHYDTGSPEPSTDKDTLGRTTTYAYDPGNGRLTSDVRDGVTTSYTYDPGAGQLTDVTDTAGRHTHFIYDAGNGRLTEIDDSVTGTTKYTYDSGTGEVACDSDNCANSNITRYTYDPGTELMTQDTDPLGRTTQYFYDPINRLDTSVDPNGATDFIFTDPVPEPGSLLLLGSGLVGCFGARRRMRRAA